MAGVQTDELRDALFQDARAVFAAGGTYRDWADNFSMHGFEPSNPYHLRTNYDTAANAAYSAGHWQQIQDAKLLFPYLRYVTMQDDKVREEHAALDDLVFPVDDPFWDTYMPPNGWNCRCSVEQLMASEYDSAAQPQLATSPLQIDPQFRHNPGASLSLYLNLIPAKQTTWSADGYRPMSKYSNNDVIDPIKTDGLDKTALLNLYAQALHDRIVHDQSHVPVMIGQIKAKKLADGLSTSALAVRVRYANCLDDLIKNPNEAWFQPGNSRRIYYIKRYDKDVIAIAEIERDGVLRYFNIMTSTHVTTSIRSGIPLTPK